MTEELRKLLACVSSGDQAEIAAVRGRIDELLDAVGFYVPLMDFLGTDGMMDAEYICAAGALRMWFSRCWMSTSAEQKMDYIARLQRLLLVPHPASKFLLELYRSCRAVSADNTRPFNEFLGVVIPLISLESNLEVLVAALSVTWLTFKASISNLSAKQIEMSEIYGSAQVRIAEVETQRELVSSPTGCRALRYAFKVLDYSMSRFCAVPDIVVMHVNMIEMLLKNMNMERLVHDREYFLLVRYCGKLLTHFFHLLTRQNQDELLNRLVGLCCHAICTLSTIVDVPRSVVWSFYRIPYMHSKAIPVDVDAVRMLAMSCKFNAVDLNDFMHNPGVFYETAYPNLQLSSDQNTRRYAALIAGSMSRASDKFVQILLSQEPCEETAYLLYSVISPLLPSEFGSQVRDWCLSYFQHMKTSIDHSTILMLIAKSIDFFDKNDLEQIHSFVLKSLQMGNIVVICNALRVLRKLIRMGQTADPQILTGIIQMASVCPTDDASKTLRLLFRRCKDSVLPFATDVIASIITGIEKDLHEDELTDLQEVSICRSIDTVAEIIQSLGASVITEMLGVALKQLTENFSCNAEIWVSLGCLYFTIFESGFPHSTDLFALLLSSCNPNSEMRIHCVAPAISKFMEKWPQVFLEMNGSQKLLPILVELLVNFAAEQEEEAACADLIAWTIQLDKSVDVNALFASLCSVNFLNPANKLEIWASAFLDNRIPFDAATIQDILLLCQHGFPCLYEKHLYAGVLLKAGSTVTGESSTVFLSVAAELIRALSEQKHAMASTPHVFPCGHNFTFPVQSLALPDPTSP